MRAMNQQPDPHDGGGRGILGTVLVVISFLGILESVWFLLALAFVIRGPAGNAQPSLHELLTQELGSLLGCGIGAFWPAGGIIYGIYLLATRWRRRSTIRDISMLAVVVAAVVLAPIGLAVWATW